MIYFVIPVYNEEENLPNLKRELEAVHLNEEKFYVFCDDGSKDKSREAIAALFNGLNYHITGDGSNHGPGKAFDTGFEWVLANCRDSDIVVTIEADCTSDTAILSDMITISNLGYDLVLASVYTQSGHLEKTNFMRKFISSVANMIMRFVFNIRVLTLSSFYRVYKVSLLKRIKEKYNVLISEPGFICMLEILHKAIKVNAKIIEVPTVLRSGKRIGKSKMKIFKTSLTYLSYLVRNISR
jgi:glycosyltransferase involved in cell wall biosynthesis